MWALPVSSISLQAPVHWLENLIWPGSAYQVDVTQWREVETTVNVVVNDFNGRLDCFIANSGIACESRIKTYLSVDHIFSEVVNNIERERDFCFR